MRLKVYSESDFAERGITRAARTNIHICRRTRGPAQGFRHPLGSLGIARQEHRFGIVPPLRLDMRRHALPPP